MGLKFKGEKPLKKKRSKHHSSTLEGGGISSSASHHSRQDDEDLTGWIDSPSASLLLGPSYLTLPSTKLTPSVCIALQPTTGKVYPFVLPQSSLESGSSKNKMKQEDLSHLDPEELEALVEIEQPRGSSLEDEQTLTPSEVHHVWVCTRVPDTNDRVTFRSGSGKFLASDELGRVTAEREARGPQEEWTIEECQTPQKQDHDDKSFGGDEKKRYWLKSMYGKCLSVDVVAGGKIELRCDGTLDEEDETERWRITMQGEFVAKAKKQYNDRNGIKTIEGEESGRGGRGGSRGDGLTIVGSLAEQERQNILKFQARGGRKYIGTEEDAKDLKRARKDGKLSEAMLDRRTKLKSDRYC